MIENLSQSLNPEGSLVKIGDTGEVRLVGSQCSSCGNIVFPQTDVCPACMSEEISPINLSSQGTLYSWSVVHAAPKGWELPFIAAYVDLPEDVRVFAHIIDADPASLVMDMPVEVCMAFLGEDEAGQPLQSYAFTPIKFGEQ